MSNASSGVEHLRNLAEHYRNVHLELQKRYKETGAGSAFLAELRQRETSLLDRFRLVQQDLLNSLQDEQLEKMLDLSRIFDELRVINLFEVQALRDTKETDSAT